MTQDIYAPRYITQSQKDFDDMWIYPLYYYLTQQDIDALRKIALSLKLSSNIKKKFDMIDDIMRPRGFKFLSAGTNRVVYSHLEDTRLVCKIALDKVGMQDNPREYMNQFIYRPYVAKMFYTSPCGTVGFAERVLPIRNSEEFRLIADDVCDLIVYILIGDYVLDDIGSHYFKNYGIRVGFGPVLLDYPYVYKLDGNKLFCGATLPDRSICNGEITYDAGFNNLICPRCGKKYKASDLRDNNHSNKLIIRRGGKHMKVKMIIDGKEIFAPGSTDDVIRPNVPEKKLHHLKIAINKDGEMMKCYEDYDDPQPKEEKPILTPVEEEPEEEVVEETPDDQEEAIPGYSEGEDVLAYIPESPPEDEPEEEQEEAPVESDEVPAEKQPEYEAAQTDVISPLQNKIVMSSSNRMRRKVGGPRLNSTFIPSDN